MKVLPDWIKSYRRAWVWPDIVAGVIVWGVVVPQAVAYAGIAGLPPEAGLMAAPGALIAYALIGTSRTLVVSATTATSAISAAAIGPLAAGDMDRFIALSAALALIAAFVLVAGGVLRLGRLTDLVSKPVMTGFLFGLGLTVAMHQLPDLFGVEGGTGNFFQLLAALVNDLGDTQGWTLAVGAVSVLLLVVLARVAPSLPGTLIVLVIAIAGSAVLGLADRGVAVVGALPAALPDPSVPDIAWRDVVALLPAALGMMIVSAEAIGVSRAIAVTHGYAVNPNRDLIALGGSNLLAGLSQGFVQSGGASQTMAAERAGGKTQLTSIVAAGLVLLTGAFLSPLFTALPEPTLAAIVIVAIAGFFRVAELRRFAHVRRSAIVLSLLALVGVLVFGILPGLLIAAAVSLILVIQRLSRPPVGTLARDPQTGAWGRIDLHPDWEQVAGVVVARVEGPLFYANAESAKDGLLAAVRDAKPRPGALVVDLSESSDLDVATLDALADLIDALAADGIELRLAAVHTPAIEILRRGGLAARVRIEPTVDAAVR